MRVTHSFEGGVFLQVILHVGKQDLVDDNQAYDQAHDGAKGEDIADGCGLVPVLDLKIHKLLARKQAHVLRDRFPDPRLYFCRILAGFQPDKAEIDG